MKTDLQARTRALKSLPLAAMIAAYLTAAPLQATQVLAYNFNIRNLNRAVDSSGNGYHGLFQGATDPAYVRSLTGHGSAIRFNGVDQFALPGDQPKLDISRNYTTMGWINYLPTTGVQRAAELFEKGGAYWINIEQTTFIPRAGGFFAPCDVVGSRYQYLDGPAPLPSGTWIHIAAVHQGPSLRLFVNGMQVAKRSIPAEACINDNPLAVGATHVPAKDKLRNYVNGMLDDVRIFNNALDAAGIRYFMNSE